MTESQSARYQHCFLSAACLVLAGTEMGMHVTSQTFIDPEALLQEIEQSADMLTHGLVCECCGHIYAHAFKCQLPASMLVVSWAQEAATVVLRCTTLQQQCCCCCWWPQQQWCCCGGNEPQLNTKTTLRPICLLTCCVCLCYLLLPFLLLLLRHTAVAHTGSNEMEHHINQLRHDGTRVVPVFVLALQNHPEDVVMANK